MSHKAHCSLLRYIYHEKSFIQSENKTVASIDAVISIFKWKKNFVTLKEDFNFFENTLSF